MFKKIKAINFPTRVALGFLIFLITVCIILVSMMRVNRLKAEDCQCMKYKTYQEFTLHPDGSLDFRTDSICIISATQDGAITTKKLN